MEYLVTYYKVMFEPHSRSNFRRLEDWNKRINKYIFSYFVIALQAKQRFYLHIGFRKIIIDIVYGTS